MIHQIANATIQALGNFVSVQLKYNTRNWAFGLGDDRDPRLTDKKLNVLQATALRDDKKVIATVVQWGFHPEITLGYSPSVNNTECKILNMTTCTTRGVRFF